MRIQTFKTEEEFLAAVEEMRKLRENEYARSEDWQRKMTTGDHYLRFEQSYGIVIYGFITELKYEEDRQLYASPRMAGTRPVRAFSAACPDGEFGNQQVAGMHVKISKEAFEMFRAKGWPEHPHEAVTLLGVLAGSLLETV